MGRPVDYALIYRLEDERAARERAYVCPLWTEVNAAALRMGERWATVPANSGFNGRVVLSGPGTVLEADAVAGEIVQCGECGHTAAFHYEDDEGWLLCQYGTYFSLDGWLSHPCNCGNNIGR